MLLNFLLIIFLLLLCNTIVYGSHFLGGTINWRIQNISANGTSVAVLITQTYSWTYVTGRCDNSSIVNNQIVYGTSSGILMCAPSCPSGFGSVSAAPYCTDVSTLNGVAVGQRLDTVVIPVGSDFSVVFNGSAWNSLISGSSTWSVTSRINLVKRSDNNMFNNAPVVTVMSPINIQANQTTFITASISDADGDVVRCRWANASSGVDECGSVCPPSSLPIDTILYSNCTIKIMGSTIGALYAVTFIAEDFISSSSTTPLSSVPVQFIVKVIAPSSCSTLSETIHIGQACTTVKVNETYTSQLLAINNCGTNVSIIDIATISFSGMSQSSIFKLNSRIYYKTLTWIPTINQLGYQVMCAIALDSQYEQSPQYCFTFFVTENGTDACPETTNSTIVITSTTSTSTTSTSATSTSATSTSTTTVSTIFTSTTTKTLASNSIDWPLITSLAVLGFLFAIFYSGCMLHRYYKRSIAKRRQKLKKNKSVNNTSSSLSTKNHSPTPISNDPVYLVEDETVDKSIICQTPINDEKIDDNDVEQTFTPYIIYPINNIIQIPSNEPDSYTQSNRNSSKLKNEKVYVKNVSLPIEQMITETRLSQIETIDLSPITSRLEPISEFDYISITSSDINQIEPIHIMENKVKASNIIDIFEVEVEQPRQTKKKHKKLPKIHANIRQKPQLNQ